MSAVLDFPVKPEARDFLARFARDAREPGWLAARRQQAMTRFAETGFPSRKNENWRYLDLQPLERRPLLPARAAVRADMAALGAQLAHFVQPGSAARLVLVDGRFAPELSTIEPPEGVWFAAMATAIAERPELVQEGIEAGTGDAAHPFAALNAAFFADGFVLDVAPGVVLEEPIEIIHLASGTSEASFHTRAMVSLGEGAIASLVETYAGEGRYWRNDVVSVHLAPGAALTRTVLVEEAADTVHLGQLDATVEAKARFAGFVLVLGGRRVRHEVNVCLAGEGASCEINGGFLVHGSDEANIVTAIDHAAPGGRTNELIKGVAAGRGHGAFQGSITVREHAQKTDAHQLSRNLIIGRRAVIDTKPELEIYADDVKCSHGASVGDLDEAALFYLRARGIPAEEARRMLIDGFLREAVESVEDLATRTHLLRRLAGRLDTLEE
jgi:Fe-S cluster assembly protein SufD